MAKQQVETPAEQTPEPAAQFVVKTQPTEVKTDTIEFAKPMVLPTDATPAEKGDNGDTQKEAAKTLTQEEFEKVLSARLKQERAKYADYDAMKAKLQEIEDAQKTEEQKRQEKVAALEAENKRLAAERQELTVKSAIIAEASKLGLDPDAAYKLADLKALAEDASNAAEIVKAVADTYPGLIVRRQAAQTTPANSARSTQPPARTDADRRREYFEGGNSPFWSGAGVRFTEIEQ